MNSIFLLGQGLITGVNGIFLLIYISSSYISYILRDAGVAVTKLMQNNNWKKVLLVYRLSNIIFKLSC